MTEVHKEDPNQDLRQEQPKQTYGQKMVGKSFNPAGDSDVDIAKQYYADIIDQANRLRQTSDSVEQNRLASIAITKAQEAQMWLVKAITWKD